MLYFPSIRDSLEINPCLSNDFAKIWATTQGGPGYATTTLAVYVYRLAFENFEFGYASAMGVVWLLLLGAWELHIMPPPVRGRAARAEKRPPA